MNKFKKIIVFLCLFLLSFSIVTDFKRQETQAIALVDDALLWAFGMLVLGTGVVAIKDIQVPHMGSLVLDNLRSSGVSEEEFLIKSADGVLKGVKICDKVLNAVNSVASSLPNNPFSLELGEPIPWTSGHLLSSENGILLKAKDSLLNLSAKVILTDRPIFTVAYSSSTSVYTSSQLCFNSVYDTSFNVGLVRNGDTYSIVSTCQHGSKTIVSNIDGNTPLIFGFYKDYLTAGSTNPMLDIPYDNPVIKEGYNPTYTNESMPYTAEKPGFIPVPTDTILDKPISSEIPFTWEDVKETVTDLPIEGDVPGEDIGEGEEAPSIWGWLLDILKSILNAIKSILSFITDFLAALLEGLKDLLLSLLVPSDTYFIDSFTDIKNNLSNRLNIDSYTRLFNSDYNDSSIRDITINWHGQEIVIVKFTMYENFRNIVNTLIYAFMFFLLAIYNYSQVYKLIRGSDYVSASSTITHIGGGFTDSDMRKIISHEKPYIKLGSGKK